MRTGLGFWAAKTLLSAVELGVFTELARGPLAAAALQERLGLHERGGRDFLDTLVALGFLERDEAGRYANAPDADRFLDRDKPSYVGGFLEMANARLYPFWGSLTEALRTGEPQSEAKAGVGDAGDDYFARLYSDPARLRQFMRAMTGLSLESSRAIAATFPWARYGTFVDVGCAEGGLAVEVAREHGHVEGIGFDLPPVEPLFADYVESHGLADRLTFQGGDMFAEPFPPADVVTFGHVLHNWGLEQKLALLRKAYDAVPDGGAVLVFEALIDDERRESTFGLLMSLNMLVMTPAGFDYTGEDCRRWLEDAGFRETRVEPLAGAESMVVGVK